jgi:hypothetical protein
MLKRLEINLLKKVNIHKCAADIPMFPSASCGMKMPEKPS